MSLKKRLILIGVSVVIIPFFIAGIIIYVQLSRSLLDIAEDKSLHFAKDASFLISTRLRQEIRLVKSISSDPEILKACKTDYFVTAQKHIRAIHDRIGKEDFSIFILDRHGFDRADAVFSQQVGLDLSDRPYFKKAKKGKSAIAGPFKARGVATPGNPIMIASAPVLENGRFYGMVALVFSMDFMVTILSQKKQGKTGYAYLLNKSGLVLAHPKDEYILNRNLLEQPGNKNIRQIIRKKEATSILHLSEGVEKIIGMSTVEITGWKVFFCQNKDEIMGPMGKILSTILVSALVVLVVIIPIIVIFFGKFSNPIQRMMDIMQTVTRHSKECIQQISLERKVVYANPAFLTTTGGELKDILYNEPNLYNQKHTPAQDIWDRLEAGNPWSGRMIYDKTGPEPVILDTIILPLKDISGNNQGYLAIGEDITEELKYKKNLQQIQKLEAIGTLAGGIAHDFNNILSGIYGYAQLSLSRKKTREDIEKYTRRIIKSADRARDLISQILVFSRQKEVDMKALSPQPVIKEALKLLRASISTAIDIEARLESDAMILAEPTQIHQVVMNLITNAAHAIGNRTGTVKLELEDFYVDDQFIKTHPEIEKGEHVILRISDTGSGIEQDILDHIFEPFFTTKPQEKGTGLGLSVVHGIVKKVNGIITVYSELGKGTVFNIIIPCTQADDKEQPRSQVAILKGNERIVFIDDETPIVETKQMILTNLGYKVTGFTDAMSALKAIKRAPHKFELLITDYSMPNITGTEIIRDLKDAGINMPVILISGYFSNEMEEEIQHLGGIHTLRKPVDTYHLANTIRNALEKREGTEKN